jgi:hypothetical protein
MEDNFMKKYLLLVGVICLVLVSVTVAFAQLSGAADQDCFITGTTCNNTNDINVIGNSVAAPACLTPNAIGVVSIGLTPAGTETINSAQLTLQAGTFSAATAYPLTLGLFAATQDLTDDGNSPSLSVDAWTGDPLNSTVTFLTQAPAPGSDVIFPTSPEFAAAADAARNGDGRLTVVIRPTSCSGFTSTQFRATESGNPPMFTFRDPTAVEMQSFGANDSGTNPMVIVGLLLVVVIFGSFVVLRRRDNVA